MSTDKDTSQPTAPSPLEPGYYFDVRQLRLATVRAGESMPDFERGRHVRIPAPLAVPLAVALGAAFTFFLPVVGFVLVFHHVGRKLFGRRR